jgi:hypothetical protein
MDRLWNEPNVWRANSKIIAELQREHEAVPGAPRILHQDKTVGDEERFERSSSEKV